MKANNMNIFQITKNGLWLSLLGCFIILITPGCQKLIDIKTPVTSTSSDNVYNNDASAAAVLTDIYRQMSSGSIATGFGSGSTGISVLMGLSADEFQYYSGLANNGQFGYYTNSLNANGYGGEYWNSFYSIIYTCNSALEGLATSSNLTPAVKKQLLGEARFARAFCYFYLVNFYGDVPLPLTSNYVINSSILRSPKSQVYDQIISDLKEAQILLSDKYLNGTALVAYASGSEERVRPTKWAATALLARAFLYSGDWFNAEAQSTILITNTSLFSINTLANAFKKNNSEAIWQLQPTLTGYNTLEAVLFVLPTSGPNTNNPIYLSTSLVNSFESSDKRRYNRNWIDSIIVQGTTYYFPFKYKINVSNSNVTSTGTMSEYLMVLRLAEQFLIRAEARAQLNNVSGAQSDLNIIRTRAGLGNTTANDKSSLLTAVLHERQSELFSEWGNRWLDLKRTNTLDFVMNIAAPLKGASWNSYKALLPIPQEDMNRNQSLIQNPGY